MNFVDKPKPTKAVPLRAFVLPAIFKSILLNAVRIAAKSKAVGPDQVPPELFQITPDQMADVFFAFVVVCGRLVCTLPSWDESMLISLFKAGDPSINESCKALRALLIIRKKYSSATTGQVDEKIDTVIFSMVSRRERVPHCRSGPQLLACM